MIEEVTIIDRIIFFKYQNRKYSFDLRCFSKEFGEITSNILESFEVDNCNLGLYWNDLEVFIPIENMLKFYDLRCKYCQLEH